MPEETGHEWREWRELAVVENCCDPCVLSLVGFDLGLGFDLGMSLAFIRLSLV